MLSYILSFMMVISVVSSVVCGKTEELAQAITGGASDTIELIISLSGIMCLWSGVMEVAKESGLTDKLASFFSPILHRLFPDVDKNSAAFSYISMNISANMLGLGNAATPLGLKAMSELRKNSDSDVASDSMITFVVMNTASIGLLPTTVCAMRSAFSSKSPFDIIVCVWVTSIIALFFGLMSSKICSTIRRKKCTL